MPFRATACSIALAPTGKAALQGQSRQEKIGTDRIPQKHCRQFRRVERRKPVLAEEAGQAGLQQASIDYLVAIELKAERGRDVRERSAFPSLSPARHSGGKRKTGHCFLSDACPVRFVGQEAVVSNHWGKMERDAGRQVVMSVDNRYVRFDNGLNVHQTGLPAPVSR